MAFFGKKKDKTEGDAAAAPPAATGGGNGVAGSNGGSGGMDDFTPHPEKARKWFSHARTAADAYNYEYALTCFANGIKFDPEDMAAHVDMYDAAVRLRGKGGKPASGRDIRAIEGPHPVDKFAAAEFAWMRNLTSASLGLKLAEATVNAGQHEFGRWFAPKFLNVLRQQKKPSKNDFMAAMRYLGEVGAWEQSITAGEIALQLDPTDGALQAEIKNLAAQRAMDQGGYDQVGGEQGGFRKFVRDADRQREIEEEESLSGAGSSEERVLERAKRAYEADPTNAEALNRYAQLLKRPGTPQAEDAAYRVYMKGYTDTKEYRFRMAASDIKIAQAERRVRDLEARSAASPDDRELAEQLDEARREMLTYKAAEFGEREERYPTDRGIKYHRGEVEFALGNWDTAMPAFQQAKEEPKLRVRAGYMLARCFAAEDWHSDAVAEFREALENVDPTTREWELPVRYDLMRSLIALAKSENSVDHAKEALEVCSTIARKDITYRDIRQRRKEIDELLKEMSGAS